MGHGMWNGRNEKVGEDGAAVGTQELGEMGDGKKENASSQVWVSMGWPLLHLSQFAGYFY